MGTVVPGVGTIAYFGSFVPPVAALPLAPGAAINARGKVLLAATMTKEQVALLVASPTHG